MPHSEQVGAPSSASWERDTGPGVTGVDGMVAPVSAEEADVSVAGVSISAWAETVGERYSEEMNFPPSQRAI